MDGAMHYVPLISLIINIALLLVGSTWGLGKIRDTVQQEVRAELKAMRERFEDDIDGLSRNSGDAISALREKVNQVELAAYKDFIRRDSFLDIMNRVSGEIVNYKNDMNDRLARQEEKLDKLIGMRT